MTKANAEFLEANRDCYLEVVHAETAIKANKIKADLLRIMREDFLPGYSFTDDCGSCLFDLVRLLYRRFDEWKEKNRIETSMIEKLSNMYDQGIGVKATFPSHKEYEPDIKLKKKHHRK